MISMGIKADRILSPLIRIYVVTTPTDKAAGNWLSEPNKGHSIMAPCPPGRRNISCRESRQPAPNNPDGRAYYGTQSGDGRKMMAEIIFRFVGTKSTPSL